MRPTLRSCLWGLLAVGFLATVARADYAGTVIATSPIAYFRLEAPAADPSQVGTYTSSFTGGTTLAQPGVPICAAGNHYAAIDGAPGSTVSTTLTGGGITTAGSIVAWVKLATPPSTAGRILYIAGESQVGNDFDLQFTTDNYVNFYASWGPSVGYLPEVSTLVGRWHMVAATFNAATGVKTLYWDGMQVATDSSSGVFPNKAGAFMIGESPVFSGRNFNGGIDEVAVWNSELTPAQVSAIYAASCAGTTTVINSPAPGGTTSLLEAFTVSASAMATNPAAGVETPALTGTITVSDGTAICMITLPATSCDLMPATSGPNTLTATYSGDANFNASKSAGVDHDVNGALDVDASISATRYDALTDGLLTLRYLFGLTGTPLTNGAVGATATRTDPAAVKGYLDAIRPLLDVDGNGVTDALTDGLLIIRYLFGLRGDALIHGAVGLDATRTLAGDIEAYIRSLGP
jgi:hypothetical protein